MGSNYYGEGNPGNERGSGFSSSSSSSSSSRKGKKGSSDKPKQPQRGLGVAQLEKIRLHSQLGSNYLPPVHNPYAPSFSQEDIRLQTAYSSSSSSLSHSSASSPSYGFRGPHAVMVGLASVVLSLELCRLRHGILDQGFEWHPGNAGMGTQHFAEPCLTTRPFFQPTSEGSINNKNKQDGNNPMGSSSQNTDSSSSEDIDLELRLSL
ncbi:protein SPEAR3 [Sesamum angolense]|uniref:Protein SPEAR3 n=1 Tax=Sesamum angolense TaxID=2727404 RepID=A0AAE1WE66_9LAMI|nr:protein SPEAR3 [Sesamum angolense]